MRVLVIEDDAELAETIAVFLRRRQLAVDVALDGRSGLDRALFTDYDVVVLDRDLPRVHGDDVCAEIAAAGCRIRALLRRAGPALPPVLVSGEVTLDSSRREAYRNDKKLDLTGKELAVLELLLAAGGRVVSAEELLERVWDEMADPFSGVVKVTIRRLRGKLGDPPVIETIGHGYRI